MSTNLMLLMLMLIQFVACGQRIGFDAIDDSKVNPWIPKLTSEYYGVYNFGDSEMESDLILFSDNDRYYAQIKSGAWSDDGKAWVWHYENLTNVSMEGNKFYSDKTNGEFVIYDNGQEKIKGLKVFNSWSPGLTENGEYEIGIKIYPIATYYSGHYPQASAKLLTKDELQKMTKAELRLMRNEIFARYGYKFKMGGEMDSYFKSQNWYSAQHDEVNSFLTEVEKENIQLIQQIENE